MIMALHVLSSGPTRELLDLYRAHQSDPNAHLAAVTQGLWSFLQVQALNGNIKLIGIPPGDSRSNEVELGLVKSAKADLESDTLATAIGVFSGVMVVGVAMACEQEALLDAKPGQATSDAAEWMAANVTAPGQWKRDNALAQCQSVTGGSYRDALAAWNRLPTGLRGTRGARK